MLSERRTRGRGRRSSASGAFCPCPHLRKLDTESCQHLRQPDKPPCRHLCQSDTELYNHLRKSGTNPFLPLPPFAQVRHRTLLPCTVPRGRDTRHEDVEGSSTQSRISPRIDSPKRLKTSGCPLAIQAWWKIPWIGPDWAGARRRAALSRSCS